jgi:hypothetical protein
LTNYLPPPPKRNLVLRFEEVGTYELYIGR